MFEVIDGGKLNGSGGSIHGNEKLRSALDWAARGIRIVPAEIVDGDKKPKIEGWKYLATVDPAQIVEWWTKWPDAEIGAVLGGGLLVIDVDVKNGKQGLKSLAELGVSLDCTLCVQTPSGGYQLYFMDPNDYSNAVEFMDGVDCRSRAGLAMAPGSFYGLYVLAFDKPIAPLPEALKRRLTLAKDVQPPRALVALDEPENIEAAILWLRTEAPIAKMERGGNDQFFRVCAELMRDRAISPDIARELVLRYYDPRCEPSWAEIGDWKDFDKTFNSAAVNAQGSIGTKTRQGMFGDGPVLPSTPPAAQPQAAQAPEEDENTPLPFVGLGDLLESPAPPREFIVPGWLPKNTVTLFAGDGGIGKSTLAAQLAIAMATGTQWLGLDVNPGKCLILSAEDETGEFHYRAELFSAAARAAHGTKVKALLNNVHFLDATEDLDPTLALYDAKTTVLQPTVLFKRIKRMVERYGLDLVIIDAAADVFAEELNRYAVRSFLRLLRTLKCTVLLLAHPSVDGMKSGRGYSGSTHWSNSVRARIYFEYAAAEDGSVPDPDLRTLTTKKTNRGKTGDQLTVRWTPNGFVRADAAEQAIERMAANQEVDAVFLSLLTRVNGVGQRVSSKPGPTFAPSRFAEMDGNQGITREAFNGAMMRLLEARKIEIITEGRPSKQRTWIDVVEG